MPKIRHLDSLHPSYALRARSAGAPRLRIRICSSLAQNPNPQRLRRRFFMPKIRHLDSLHPSYALRAPSAGAPPKSRGTSIHKCAFCYFSYPGLARFAKA